MKPKVRGTRSLIAHALLLSCVLSIVSPPQTLAQKELRLLDVLGEEVSTKDLAPNDLYEHCVAIIVFRSIDRNRVEFGKKWINKFSHQLQTISEAESAVNQMLDDLGDQYSSLWKEQPGAIGATLASKNGQALIDSVDKDSPAAVAGVHAEDVIVRVDGSPVPERISSVRQLIRGPANTPVKLDLERNGSPLSVTINRSDQDFNPESYFTMFGNFAYTRPGLPFTKQTKFDAFRSAIASLKQAKAAGLILDLRSAVGDMQAVKMCSLFIGQKPAIGKNDHGTVSAVSGPDDAATDLPMVLLINRGALVEADQVAACLKHYHRAKLVGERTTSRAMLTEQVQVDRTHLLVYTHCECVTPDGSKMYGVGVEPDVLVDVDHKNIETGPWWNYSVGGKAPTPLTGKDVQLQRAIEELTKMVGSR